MNEGEKEKWAVENCTLAHDGESEPSTYFKKEKQHQQ